jgi:predicted nucleic acid-binding protein
MEPRDGVLPMTSERLFVDSGFFVARFNRRDQFHDDAQRLARRFDECSELWTTEAVLLEIGAAFSEPSQRTVAVAIWDELHGEARYRVVAVSGSLLDRAMQLFRERSDKAWSLTDCASFLVMQDEQLTLALSCDHHFVQAGFRALLLEESHA